MATYSRCQRTEAADLLGDAGRHDDPKELSGLGEAGDERLQAQDAVPGGAALRRRAAAPDDYDENSINEFSLKIFFKSLSESLFALYDFLDCFQNCI